MNSLCGCLEAINPAELRNNPVQVPDEVLEPRQREGFTPNRTGTLEERPVLGHRSPNRGLCIELPVKVGKFKFGHLSPTGPSLEALHLILDSKFLLFLAKEDSPNFNFKVL